MRIISRQNEDQIQCERLRGIIEAATNGHVTPARALPDLVTQVEDTFMDYMEDVENLEDAYDNLKREVVGLTTLSALQEQKLEELTFIGFDEALDHATTDLMDAFMGSGAASSTFGGDISFDPDVVFTKQDLKPLLRQAIITWVTTKVN